MLYDLIDFILALFTNASGPKSDDADKKGRQEPRQEQSMFLVVVIFIVALAVFFGLSCLFYFLVKNH
jgi:hypothetical protein